MKSGLAEADVLRSCLEYLKMRGILSWRNNSTGVWDPQRGTFRRFSGLKGTADILGILPRDLNRVLPGTVIGQLLACETKGPRGVLSADQAAFLDAVRANGGIACVVHSVGELQDALREAGVG